MQTARIVTQRRRTNTGCRHLPRLAQRLQGACKKRVGERHRHPLFLRRIIDVGPINFDSLFPEKQRVGGELCCIIVLGHEISVLVTAWRTALVIQQLATVSGVFNQIDDSRQAE